MILCKYKHVYSGLKREPIRLSGTNARRKMQRQIPRRLCRLSGSPINMSVHWNKDNIINIIIINITAT
jgi:hypothetical protein